MNGESCDKYKTNNSLPPKLITKHQIGSTLFVVTGIPNPNATEKLTHKILRLMENDGGEI